MKKILLFLVFGASFFSIVAMDSDSGGDEDWLPTEDSVMDEAQASDLADSQLPECSPVDCAEYIQPQQNLDEQNPLSIQEAALIATGCHIAQQPANPPIVPDELQSVPAPVTDHGSDQEMQLLIPPQYPANQPLQEPSYMCAADNLLFENHDDSEQVVESEEIESTSKKRQTAVAIEALAMMPATKKLCTGPTRKCETCHKIISVRNYAAHLRTHTGEKPYKCPDCHQSFTDRSTLTKHKRTHTGEKPFKCSYCSKSFSQPGHLTRHKRIHTGEKPFKCPDCSKSFTEQTHLTLHMRTHTEERSYICPECGASFRQSAHLNRHIKIDHDKILPFVCQDCHKAFSTKQNLDLHAQSKKHSGKFTCQFCKVIYASGKAYANHLLSHKTAENAVAIGTAPIAQS